MRGEQLLSIVKNGELVKFNSRPCGRGDCIAHSHSHSHRLFQFTPLREGRLEESRAAGKHPLFQFTPLREGRPSRSSCTQGTALFQFTPLREGRPTAPATSTAPAIFQFTPLREGRRNTTKASSRAANFNSRPCGRGDETREDVGFWEMISIHAPAGGATVKTLRLPEDVCQFQFTPLREGRRGALVIVNNSELFQFTPLREGRRPRPTWPPWSAVFQFTPLREGRPLSGTPFADRTDFNSRPCGRGDISTRAALPPGL